MNYDKLIDELDNYMWENRLICHLDNCDRDFFKKIISKYMEEPVLKLVIEDCKVRNVVTGEIK